MLLLFYFNFENYPKGWLHCLDKCSVDIIISVFNIWLPYKKFTSSLCWFSESRAQNTGFCAGSSFEKSSWGNSCEKVKQGRKGRQCKDDFWLNWLLPWVIGYSAEYDTSRVWGKALQNCPPGKQTFILCFHCQWVNWLQRNWLTYTHVCGAGTWQHFPTLEVRVGVISCGCRI